MAERFRNTLHQLCVSLNGSFNPLWLYANIPLCNRRAAVLKEPPNKRDVITIVFCKSQ